MYQNINLEKIMGIHRRRGEEKFRIAIQYLFETGKDNFTEDNVKEIKRTIRKTTQENAIMTADFRIALVEIARELSVFPTWDILLYVRLYLHIEGDDLLQYEEAEQALNGWNRRWAPEAWKDAVADPDMRAEILRELVEQHEPEYTVCEIEDAIRVVVD